MSRPAARAGAGDQARVSVMVRVPLVIHRGWSALADNHPARHGLLDAAFARMIGLWWGDQLSSFRQLAEPGADGDGGAM